MSPRRMQTMARAVTAGLVVVTTALAAACRAAEPVPAASTVVEGEWRPLGHWSGRLSQLTESFEVSPAAMRLRWQTSEETAPGRGRLQVTLHSAASGRVLHTIVNAHGVASGTEYVADETRWAYFVIEAEGVAWQVTLEHAVAVEPR